MVERKKYNDEFKARAVRLALETSPGEAIKKLGIPQGTMHGWLQAYKNGKLDIGMAQEEPSGDGSGKAAPMPRQDQDPVKEEKQVENAEKAPMYAIVDVGSNTVRMNIYKMEYEQLSLVLGRKESVGLAFYVKNGYMTPAGIDKVSQVLREFRILLSDLHITNVHVFATAALRNAKNSKKAVEEIETRSGLPIQVISGDMEAELDFEGASHAVNVSEGLLVDIGGGSTELVSYKNGKMVHAVSIPLGSLNTYMKFVSNLLPTRAERKAIKQAVIDEIKKDENISKGTYSIICGVGGTARAANKLNKDLFQLPLDHATIKAPNIKKMIKLLENEEGAAIPVETLDVLLRVVPDRVRTVLPGMIILNTIVKYFKAESVEVTNAGVRDGFLYRFVLPKAQGGAKHGKNGREAD